MELLILKSNTQVLSLNRVSLSPWQGKILKKILLPGALLAIFFALNNPVFASCGAANCFLVTGTQEGLSAKGQFIADISFRHVALDRGQRGTQRVDQVFTPKVNFEGNLLEPNHHREVKTLNNLAQLDLSYGVTTDLTIQLAVPFFNQRVHEHFDGLSAANPEGTFFRSDGTDGFGDVRVIGKYNLLTTTKHLVVGGLGVKLPTGESNLRDSFGAINEPTLMPGTGSLDALASVFYAYQIFPHELEAFFSGSYQFNSENSREYLFGNTTLLNGGIGYQALPYLYLSGQINARIQPHDQFIGQHVDGTGGEWVNLTPGVRLQPNSTTQLYAFGQIPVYQRINESNLVPSWGILFGFSKTFGLLSGES